MQYGNPLNKRLGCGYYTQLVNGVDDYLNGKSEMIADIKNSHGFTLLILFTTLVCEKASFSNFQISYIYIYEYIFYSSFLMIIYIIML